MATFVVTAIRARPEDGWITHLQVQEADTWTRQPIGRLMDIEAEEAATRILADDAYFPVFAIEGHRVLGPRLRYLQISGNESVQDAANCPDGRSVRDLPRF